MLIEHKTIFMEFRHLRYFCAVAEEKSFTHASYRLGVNQSVISRQVKALENDLQVELLDRDTSRVQMTAAGREFYQHAQKILQQVSDARLSLCGYRAAQQNQLRIAYMPQFLQSFLSQAVDVFTQAYPELAIEFVELAPGKQVTALREDKVDIAFAGMLCSQVESEFDVFTIDKIPLSALFLPAHPIARCKQVTWSDLKACRIIGLSEESFPGRMEMLQEYLGESAQFIHQADSISSLLAYVATGAGVAIVPHDVGKIIHQDMIIRKIRPEKTIGSQALVKSGEKRKIVRAFLQECRNQSKANLAK